MHHIFESCDLDLIAAFGAPHLLANHRSSVAFLFYVKENGTYDKEMTWRWNSLITCGNADERRILCLIDSRNGGGDESASEVWSGAEDVLSIGYRGFFIRKLQTMAEGSILSSVKELWRRDEGAWKSSWIYSKFLWDISAADRYDHDLSEHCSITGTRTSAVANRQK